MTDLPTLDDLEREVVRTLSAKAGQLGRRGRPVPPRCCSAARPSRRHAAGPSPGRGQARRLLAAAAALALVAAGGRP